MYRELLPKIQSLLSGKTTPILLILGLRQTGKTTLVKNAVKDFKHQLFNFDLPSDQAEFVNQNRHSLETFAQRYRGQIILIDEVQKQPEAIPVIKHLYDQYQLKFVLTGSSELKIKKGVSDTLAGRLKIFRLYPLSLEEMFIQQKQGLAAEPLPYDSAQTLLQKVLVYGSLPAVSNLPPQEWAGYLKDFTETLLSKDILEISAIRNPTKVMHTAKLLAMQVGQLVNVNELAVLTELSRSTIYDYLDILEQLSIIKRAYPLSTNERRAISSKCKVYFTDLGMRNYLIGNFSPLNSRLDGGSLLENLAYLSLARTLDYSEQSYSLGFFRDEGGSELDMVLRRGNREQLLEVKKTGRPKRIGNVTYLSMENIYQLGRIIE